MLRGALKEPARSAALARDAVAYNRNVFVGGVPQGKGECRRPVSNLWLHGVVSRFLSSHACRGSGAQDRIRLGWLLSFRLRLKRPVTVKIRGFGLALGKAVHGSSGGHGLSLVDLLLGIVGLLVRCFMCSLRCATRLLRGLLLDRVLCGLLGHRGVEEEHPSDLGSPSCVSLMPLVL